MLSTIGGYDMGQRLPRRTQRNIDDREQDPTDAGESLVAALDGKPEPSLDQIAVRLLFVAQLQHINVARYQLDNQALKAALGKKW